jgi:hypothetical protein
MYPTPIGGPYSPPPSVTDIAWICLGALLSCAAVIMLFRGIRHPLAWVFDHLFKSPEK